jgi:hypothetical protein
MWIERERWNCVEGKFEKIRDGGVYTVQYQFRTKLSVLRVALGKFNIIFIAFLWLEKAARDEKNKIKREKPQMKHFYNFHNFPSLFSPWITCLCFLPFPFLHLCFIILISMIFYKKITRINRDRFLI